MHSLPNIVWVIKSKKMIWEGHVTRMGGGTREMHTELCGESWRKDTPPELLRHRREDNIKMYLQETGREGVN
jgi:hypothetical protein